MTARQPDPSKPFIVADTLAEALAEAGIDTKRLRLAAGINSKGICPVCGGGRSQEISLSVSVDADGAGARWKCHRGNCAGGRLVPGSARIAEARRDEDPQRRERPPPKPPATHAQKARNEALYTWFERRAISRVTVDEFGIFGCRVGFPFAGGWQDKNAIAFPYTRDRQTVNHKYRSADKEFRQDGGARRTMFNFDACAGADDEVVLVEGEMDVLALHEAGITQAMSLPDGSPQALMDEDDPKRGTDKRFDALEDALPTLSGVRRIVIATDADQPGRYLAEEFARRLGRARCWVVAWPNGCKDSNDVLIQHGRDELARRIREATPWPLAGLWEPAVGSLHAFLTSGREPRGLESGIADLDDVARLPAGGGWLTVLTGVPSHGKTTLLASWLARVAGRHDLGIVWCSPEDQRPETLALRIAAILAKQPTKEAGTYMPRDVLDRAEDWIRRRLTVLWSDDPDQELTLDWMLARAEEAKRRYPRSLLVLDPWSDLEHQIPKGESEHVYIGRTLTRLKKWGRAEGMSLLIAAHPLKLQRDPKTRKWPIAQGYDISGSAHWYNRADLGLTVYRAEEGFLEAHCWKARFRAFGQQGKHCRLKIDARIGSLSSSGAPVADDLASAAAALNDDDDRLPI
jgi:twinkle protein